MIGPTENPLSSKAFRKSESGKRHTLSGSRSMILKIKSYINLKKSINFLNTLVSNNFKKQVIKK